MAVRGTSLWQPQAKASQRGKDISWSGFLDTCSTRPSVISAENRGKISFDNFII